MGISSGLLTETFYPQTLTSTDDGMGGVTQAWADGTAFKGRLSSLPVAERMSADKLTVYASHKLFCDYSSISEKDRIRNLDSTRYFEIKGIVSPSNMNHHLEITLLEID
uniref:Putative head-tail joining protein n=1 Tax=viral metagenome TaxID=1070528 RepID=A0A6M3KH89_9ZZZZ